MLKNWIEDNRLPAVRIGRRVRVRRVDLDRMLAQGATAAAPDPAPAAPAEALSELADARQRARALLNRRSATRRPELAEGLQQLTDAVATALDLFADEPSSPPSAAKRPRRRPALQTTEPAHREDLGERLTGAKPAVSTRQPLARRGRWPLVEARRNPDVAHAGRIGHPPRHW